jgi:hypothetical protein
VLLALPTLFSSSLPAFFLLSNACQALSGFNNKKEVLMFSLVAE